MFEHSVKVPRHYKIAADILKRVLTEGGSIKTILYDNKLRHFRTDVLFALVTETIKNASIIDSLFECTEILQKESRLNPWLAKILTTELIFGKKCLPGQSKPELTVLSYQEQFENWRTKNPDVFKTSDVRRPRYLRVNTTLLSTSDMIDNFKQEGFRFIRCTSGSYDDYLQQIRQLTPETFVQDYHVKTVFAFHHTISFWAHSLYDEHKIILQDRSTSMAVHLLAPPSGSTVLDMCAAPGMKTTHMAAYMGNKGKIYAVERNEERYKTLCKFVSNTNSHCVTTMNKDVLEIKRGELDDVEYILLDPSCSGSGMDLSVHSYIDENRLAKLTSLQEKFLKHAMNAFPNAKRIVYSTCSLRPEENERVITNVVKTSRVKWRVQDVKQMLKGQWNSIGSAMYGSMGVRCMYCKPNDDLTTGFFLAVLDRDRKETSVLDEDNTIDAKGDIKNEDVKEPKAKNKNTHKEEKNVNANNDNSIDKDNEMQNMKSKKETELVTDNNIENIDENRPKKNKSKKEKRTVDVDDGNSIDTNKDNEDRPKTKKSKKDTQTNDVNYDNNIDKETVDSAKKMSKKEKQNIYVDNDNKGGKDGDVNDDIGFDKENKDRSKKKESKKEAENIEEDGNNVDKQNEDRPKKKSKKETTNIELDNDVIEDYPKKKKSKKETRNIELDNDVIEDHQKKKKSKKETRNIELDNDVIEDHQKKKMSKKETTNIELDNDEDHPKKKKSKKETTNIELNYDVIEDRPKKKKTTKEKPIVDVNSDIIDEDLDHPKRKKLKDGSNIVGNITLEEDKVRPKKKKSKKEKKLFII